MDFQFTAEQDDAAELAATIIRDHTSNEQMKAVEAAGDRFDRTLWDSLSDAGLLSLHLPERHGGAGLGVIELARVLVEVGRAVAPIPLATHGPAGLLLAETGSESLQSSWLPRVASGDTVLTAAVTEEVEHLPDIPTVVAEDTHDGSATITGTKTLVRAGMTADAMLVTAWTGDGASVYLVDATSDGVDRSAQHTSDGDTTALVSFDRAPGIRVGDAESVTRLTQLLTVAAAAEQLGITEGALALTSKYAGTREQFGRPIGTFQAVSQRLADGFIDVVAQRLTLWQAVWRLSEGLPAANEVAVAKFWAAEAGHRLAHTTVHVHGGVGIDLDGEAHRYFTSAKRFEFAFGGATQQALKVGQSFA